MPQKRSEANRKTNIGVARAVPIFLLAIIGYASWVVTKVICIDYLIRPPPSLLVRPQRASAIAVLVTYYVLLVVVLISYGRLIDVVARHPGLIPRGPQWYAERSRQKCSRDDPASGGNGSRSEDEKSNSSDLQDSRTPKEIRYLADETLPFRVEDFWLKDVFVCQPDGRPAFCSTCYNWKPDRSHHCSELNRCILKFDHFCPWVGGAVSETSFKFFIQFTFYSVLYTFQILVVVAYFFAQYRRSDSNFLNAHWIVLLAIAALFFLFSGGMCMSTGQFAFINSTTIENLNRKTKVWSLAIYTSPQALNEAHEKGIQLRLISYPRPAEEQLQMLQQHGAQDPQSSTSQASSDLIPLAGHRTFAIFETAPGANPFDLGFLANFQDIMGTTTWEWLLPIKPSPCLRHDSPTSLYKTGAVVDDLKANSGLASLAVPTSRRVGRRRHHDRDESTRHVDRSA